MGERLDRALALAERFVAAVERIADATQPRARAATTPDPEPSDTDKAAARKYARRLGVVVRGSAK